VSAKPNLTALLAPTRPVQTAENPFFVQRRDERSVDTAMGATLDLLGKIVKQGRGGFDDATYHRYIRARIAANNRR
jgi:hypothetical protein